MSSVAGQQKQTKSFKTEVKQLLHLMIHSLYSHSEIFLRELISNASDACDKLRFEAMNHPDWIQEEGADYGVWVELRPEQGTLHVRDNGIGMSYDEVVSHLGTIAHSGTRAFLERLTGDKTKDAQLIGQFGVGFYSSFMVADRVEVKTRRAGLSAEEGVHWSSIADGEYEIESLHRQERGTEVVLHLKEEAKKELNDWRIRHIMRKYSDHIALPIYMHPETVIGDEEKKEALPEWEIVNRATALWTLPKSDVSEEQYKELYKHVAHDYEDPLAWVHNKVEGKQEYTSLLYIPARAPFDLYQASKPRGLQLYVQRVFIMDDAEAFLPNYLRFIRGIVDSNDLPLNVSREILQSNKVIEGMKAAITKRVLGLLEQMATEKPDDYKKFWKEFGQVLKEGPAEDFVNREQIAKLFRFYSTEASVAGETSPSVSLDIYLSRMKPGQDKIYYVIGEGLKAAQHSPHLEVFKKQGIEVLLLTDRIDEWLMSHLHEFGGKSLQSITKGGLELETVSASLEEDFKAVLEKAKQVLGDKVKSVRLTARLTTSPSCVVSDEHEMSIHMERILKAAGQKVPVVKPILELNPEHAMVKRLRQESNEVVFKTWVDLLFEQAVLTEGGHLEDPAGFVQRMNDLLVQSVLL